MLNVQTVNVSSMWDLAAGVWVFVTLLPVLILNGKKEDRPLSTRDYVGWGLWGLGFLFEVIADHQKSAFKANPANAVGIFVYDFFVSNFALHTCNLYSLSLNTVS